MKLDLTEWKITEIILEKETNSIKIIADNDNLEILLTESAYNALVSATS